jgi:hypothetical protein
MMVNFVEFVASANLQLQVKGKEEKDEFEEENSFKY